MRPSAKSVSERIEGVEVPTTKSLASVPRSTTALIDSAWPSGVAGASRNSTSNPSFSHTAAAYMSQRG